MLPLGTRYTDPFWRDTFINFREKDGAQLYNKIGATNIQARGYLRIDSGLNATGVQSFLNQHLYEEWLGVGQPFSKKPTETYYSIATTTYLGSDDTDLVWALGMNGTEGLLQSKEIMATFASFTVVKQSEQFSRSLLDVGNSILAPASVVLAIIVFMMGSGRYQPIGIVQKSFINPMGWVRRQYGISPLVSNDVDARLQNLEEFMDLLKDHYIEIHPSLLGGPASAQFQKTPQDA
ncbi:hypothetical protein DFJ77DRAFT_265492 [Powellomyces hirtus]|nr:hypothetical protein DFJ77DRAFT_265492 [Powellomyces hirtus]